MSKLSDASRQSAKVDIVRVIHGQRPPRPDDDHFRLYSPLCEWQGALEVNRTVLFQGVIQPGMLRLSAPEEREHQERSSSATALFVEIPREQIFSMFARFDYQHRPTRSLFFQPILQPSGMVQRLVRELKYADQLDSSGKKFVLNGIVEALVGVLIDRHQRIGEVKLARKLPVLTDRQFQQCCAYADDRLHVKLSLDEWAGSVGLSVSEFARRFHRKAAKTPYSWFLHRRIERGKELLAKSPMPLADIAYSLGFSSQSHFTQAFRLHEGQPPARWRSDH